ncbi:ABC transporter substrate-binding protein [Streptomyces naphthomycinicus]|uniref:ABC transporter substrate-binding protein n=1 Tax=Streptomyces naphthomycinicus TaxID=2872625 RepID=UPI001CEC5D0A|nr:ABC transporter substrate-binding protein [Streptomyces sp. TML10]
MALRRSRSGTKRLAALLTAAVLVLAGCDSEGSSSSADGRLRLTVAALPLTDSAALYLARDRGLFAKEGLEVRIQQVQQSIQALPALLKGQVGVIASANYVTYFQAYEKGTLDLRILAEGVRIAPHMMDVLVPRDSSLRSPADLAGKKIAVAVLNNIQSLTLNAILDAEGAGRPAYRQILFPQMGPALERGQVDAVHAVEPFSTAIQGELGARVLLDGGSGPARGLPASGYVTTRAFVQQHPKAAEGFRRAIEAASRLAAEHPDLVRAELPKYSKVTAAQAGKLHLPAYPVAADPARLRRLTRLMRDQGMLEKAIDPAPLLVK